MSRNVGKHQPVLRKTPGDGRPEMTQGKNAFGKCCLQQAVVWSIPVSSYCFSCVTPCSLLSEERPRRRWCHRWENRLVVITEYRTRRCLPVRWEGGGGGCRPYDSTAIGRVVDDACVNQVFSPHGQNVATVPCSLR